MSLRKKRSIDQGSPKRHLLHEEYQSQEDSGNSDDEAYGKTSLNKSNNMVEGDNSISTTNTSINQDTSYSAIN
jgi:hypothetical protein